MAEQPSISNSVTNPHPPRKKRRTTGSNSPSGSRWKTADEQRIYSSRLADALRSLRRSDSTVVAVRDAADRVLAVSARGRTRWSRALMTRRLGLRLSQIRRKHRRAARPDAGPRKPAAQVKLPPPLQRKVRALGGLVPGCRKLSLPSLLEETADYIAALEMQVKAMAFIAGVIDRGVGMSSVD
ncbi:transcription factor bHLH148 [Striga asiatica]|uniref:Transcription factor bHLH148 n=1 Tax=Striga asiatica TaxID=4170 RepID=A0A5A7QGC9_STRAF|nr:transcription factor bHLH148 [Striga asiatica]